MDAAEIATETARILAPALPVVVLGGKKAIEEVGKQAGAALFAAGNSIWEKIRPHLEKNPALTETTACLAADPNDSDLQALLRVQLRKLLENSPGLKDELEELVGKIHSHGKGNIVAGRDLNARDISITNN